MSTFTPTDGGVFMTGAHKPCFLSPESVEGLLDIFDREGAADLFNSLYEAALRADAAIPRTSGLRSAA